MDLRFEGDLNLVSGLVLALLAAIAIWYVYRREAMRSGQNQHRLTWLPGLLRALVVLLILLMLTGPVMRGTVEVGDVSRIFVVVDESKSMSLLDKTMSPQRKLLNAHRLGWLEDATIDTSSYEAAQLLADGISNSPPAGEVKPNGPAQDGPQRDRKALQKAARRAYDLLKSEPSLARGLESELLKPLDEFLGREAEETSDADWKALLASATVWQERLENEFGRRAQRLLDGSSAKVREALSRFDRHSRWKRVESGLISNDNALLSRLIDKHRVELLTVSGNQDKPRRLWQALKEPDLPEALNPDNPSGPITDLLQGLHDRIAEEPPDRQLAVVLWSDGQHNQRQSSRSPLQLAKVLASRGVPIFAVGMGAANPPRDLAVVGAKAPASVFADDRMKGSVLLSDHMPAGQPFQLTIQMEDQVVWQKQLVTSGGKSRVVEFDFSVKEIIEEKLADAADVVSLPLPLNIRIDPIEGESRDDNNDRALYVRAITRPRRALMIDSRPRWDYRYLRNQLDRDDHWKVNDCLIQYDDDRASLPRGKHPHQFPSERSQLFTYDLIILGDVPSNIFQPDELKWLAEFVATRGGGLVLMDGRRGHLRGYTDTPLESLLPVRWTGKHDTPRMPARLSLTRQGKTLAAFSLDGESERSSQIWNELPPPRWVAPVEAQPGCEVLLQAAFEKAASIPAAALRRLGAGKVLYLGFDESWRWRYEVGDKYHQRFWNQIANFVMEPPYAVHSRFVSIDTGASMLEPDDKAELRVRLRNSTGKPVVQAKAEAVLYRDDKIVSTIPLRADKNGSGVFRASTESLEPGTYKVGIRASGFRDDQLAARAEFIVSGNPTGEMNALYCDEDLLRQIAQTSGGRYLREEEAWRLPQLLAPLSAGRLEEREIALWRSWFWFLPIIGLLTGEWIVRRSLGWM